MKPWTRYELILAINLYCKTPFGRIHVRNPEIIELANFLQRTPGSVSYKLANFASLDTTLDRKGASNVSKLDKTVWNEFFEDLETLAYDSEIKMEAIRNGKKNIFDNSIHEGKIKETIVKARVNQNFFRKMILTSYESKCCITGISISKLLIASHIVPWSTDSKNRLNPQNGLCLNALHDKAFDCGLITLDESYRVVLSKEISSLHAGNTELITKSEGVTITFPNRFLPSPNFIEYHRRNVFVG